MPEDYQGNSNKMKEKLAAEAEERKKLEPVVNKDSVKIKKQSKAKKTLRSFIAEDVGSVKSYIFSDVLVPAIKDTIIDMVQNGIELLINGGVSDRKYRKKGSRFIRDDRDNYTRYYREDKEERRRSRRDDQIDEDDITLNSRAEAEQVLDSMCEAIDHYDAVSVANLYDLLGIDCTSYTAQNWGWFDLSSASVSKVAGGYKLNLPRPKYLK